MLYVRCKYYDYTHNNGTVDRVTYKAQILEDRHAVSILITLLEAKEPYIKGVLTSVLSTGSRTVPDRIKGLQDAGLVIEEQEQQRPFRKFVELTPKGRAVAEHLAAIEGILRDEG